MEDLRWSENVDDSAVQSSLQAKEEQQFRSPILQCSPLSSYETEKLQQTGGISLHRHQVEEQYSFVSVSPPPPPPAPPPHQTEQQSWRVIIPLGSLATDQTEQRQQQFLRSTSLLRRIDDDDDDDDDDDEEEEEEDFITLPLRQREEKGQALISLLRHRAEERRHNAFIASTHHQREDEQQELISLPLQPAEQPQQNLVVMDCLSRHRTEGKREQEQKQRPQQHHHHQQKRQQQQQQQQQQLIHHHHHHHHHHHQQQQQHQVQSITPLPSPDQPKERDESHQLSRSVEHVMQQQVEERQQQHEHLPLYYPHHHYHQPQQQQQQQHKQQQHDVQPSSSHPSSVPTFSSSYLSTLSPTLGHRQHHHDVLPSLSPSCLSSLSPTSNHHHHHHHHHNHHHHTHHHPSQPHPNPNHHHPHHHHHHRHQHDPSASRTPTTSLSWPQALHPPASTPRPPSPTLTSVVQTVAPSPTGLYRDNNPDPEEAKSPPLPLLFRNGCEDVWRWATSGKSHEVRLCGSDCTTALFHPNWSNGTAGIRGSKPINKGVHYWEIKVSSRVFGTSMMFGVATRQARLHADSFQNLLGADKHSWGLSHKGLAWQGGRSSIFCPPFTENVAVCLGMVYDGTQGTLTYYKNGENLGVAFTGLNSVSVDLFPALCSTAAKTEMTIGVTRRAFLSLQDRCRASVVKQLEKVGRVEETERLPLPRVLCHYVQEEAAQTVLHPL